MSTLRRLFAATLLAILLPLVPVPADAQDFWTSLGYSEVDAKDRMWMVLTSGPQYVPSVPGLRSLPAAARISFVNNATSYAKRWTQSADFKQRYADMRESRKPEKPEELMTAADRRAQDKAEMQKLVRSLDSAINEAKGMPEVQAGLRAALQQQKEMIKEIDDPKNPMYGTEAQQAFSEGQAAQRAAYAKSLKEWETTYPVSPTPIIRKSLREFLALSATVDFAARVQKTPEGGVVFVNPEYESKPPGWKALYRAGKETTATLRTAAQQWLTELK
jgi:hypothetical protein